LFGTQESVMNNVSNRSLLENSKKSVTSDYSRSANSEITISLETTNSKDNYNWDNGVKQPVFNTDLIEINIPTPSPTPGPTLAPTPNPTEAPIIDWTPTDLMRKIFTEITIIFGNNANIMNMEQKQIFEQSLLEYWSYYINNDRMIMSSVDVNEQLSLSASEYRYGSRKHKRKLLRNERELQYDYDSIDRSATAFNITTSVYIDPYCFGCPDPQTIQIDSINPTDIGFGDERNLGTLLSGEDYYFTKSKDNDDIITTPKNIYVTSSVPEKAEYFSDNFNAIEQQHNEDESVHRRTQNVHMTVTSETQISSSNSNHNIFYNAETKATPEDGLVPFLRVQQPAYFNQVDDAIAFSHTDVSLYDSLVCYINFSLVVQEIVDVAFLTCDEFTVHACSVIEEQCYPNDEEPCIT